MLTYRNTSILESDAQTIVNTVNTVGVMGKGLAAELKKRYPEMFRRYRELCNAGKLQVGQLWLWKGSDQWVLNFPTKEHWRNPSRLSYIEAGLKKFADNYEERGITEIAFPRLGCGNGGLDWEDVRPLMEKYLAPLCIRVDVHDFEKDIGLPEHKEVVKREFDRSFEGFLSELRDITERRQGLFHTMISGSPFRAYFDEDRLRIQRPGSKEAGLGIGRDDLYEVWLSLLRGPLTESELSGTAREEAEYVVPLISSLPFVRPLELRPQGRPKRLGVELLDRRGRASVASAEPCQAAFEWRSPGN